jgi:predicted RNase H-like HicB family nuclease
MASGAGMNGYIAIVLRRGSGRYEALFPDLPECTATGSGVDDALAAARSALKAYAAKRRGAGEALPEPRPAADVAAEAARHGAVGGACIQLRDISVVVRMKRPAPTGRTRKPQ